MTTLKAVILLSITSLITLSSCYQYEEACLDELSTNFNIAADSACQDCCEYPEINLTHSHLIGSDIPYNAESILTNQFGQEYKISKAFFFLNNFKFTFQDNQIENIIEKATFQNSNSKNSQDFVDDFAFISTKNTTSKLGTMKRIGIIKNIESTAGITHNLIPKGENHLLSKHDSLYDNTSYINFVIEVRHGNEFTKSKRFEIKGNDKLLTITRGVDILKEKRTSISINAIIRYDLVTNELNFETADNDSFYDVLKKVNWLNFK